MSLGRAFDPPRDLHPQTRQQVQIQEVSRRIERVEHSVPSARNGLPFSASWSNYGSIFPAGTWYAYDGRIWFEGLITNGGAYTTPNAVFTLPTGFRPTTGQIVLSPYSSVGTLRMDIDTGGKAFLYTSYGAGAIWVSLDGLSFRYA